MAPDSVEAELEVVGSSSPPGTPHPPAAARAAGPAGDDDLGAAEFANFTDKKLLDTIDRWRGNTQGLLGTTPDGGEKMRCLVNRMKKELERRRVARRMKDDKLQDQALQSKSTSSSGNDPFAFNRDDELFNGTAGKYLKKSSCSSSTKTYIQGKGAASPLSQGKCASLNKNGRMSKSSAGHQLNTRAHHQKSTDRECLNTDSDSRKKSILRICTINPQEINTKGICCKFLEDDATFGSNRRWNLSKNKASTSFKFKKNVVLLDDDDDTEPARTVDVGICSKWDESKIYYPSRTDPEAVELTYSDMKCLEPEEYLKSPVINFFLQYLKKSRPRRDLYMFNTYFYSKLEEALCTMGDRDSQFSKLRRWWRSVDIFKKAYIILPVNDHYLKAEWRHLQKDSSYDIPFSGMIWRRLSRNINREKVEVPRQRNEYDCGLFMLYYIDRFIQEAPETLIKDSLGMFGRKWFNHEEASGLREGIRALLFDLFQSAQEDDGPSKSESHSGNYSEGKDKDTDTVMAITLECTDE